MENDQLLPRLKDLWARCLNKSIVTNTFFLTPREQMEALSFCRSIGAPIYFFGGYMESERKMAFFLPDYINCDTFDPSPYIKAVWAKTPFASLSHRDFLGSLMAIGIERECIGDIIVKAQEAWFFLTPAITPHVIDTMVRVGRDGASLSELPLTDLPTFTSEIQEQTFTVQSMRADAIVAGIFRLSRSSCQELFAKGDININYFPCMDKDDPVSVGDIISLHHYGKAKILSADGKSKKGRTFVTAGIYK
ncbi:MAG: YlmH/Sll1252 family protein [Clostridiaceae bacterium]|nr:YlmH/Sll1252 family protein [Clostridiaceae bacterium]